MGVVLKTKNLNYVVRGIVALVLMILLCYIYRIMLDIKDENERLKQIYTNIEKDIYANIDDYYIYGTHLNFNGHILKEEMPNLVVQKARLLIRDKNGVNKELQAVLNDDNDRYRFTLSSNINEGVDLEELIDKDVLDYIIKNELYK